MYRKLCVQSIIDERNAYNRLLKKYGLFAIEIVNVIQIQIFYKCRRSNLIRVNTKCENISSFNLLNTAVFKVKTTERKIFFFRSIASMNMCLKTSERITESFIDVIMMICIDICTWLVIAERKREWFFIFRLSFLHNEKTVGIHEVKTCFVLFELKWKLSHICSWQKIPGKSMFY